MTAGTSGAISRSTLQSRRWRSRFRQDKPMRRTLWLVGLSRWSCCLGAASPLSIPGLGQAPAQDMETAAQCPARPVWAIRSSLAWATAGMMSSTTRSHIDVDMPTNTISATTTISARAGQALSAFNLDLHGLTVESVTVNDAPAALQPRGGRVDHHAHCCPGSRILVHDDCDLSRHPQPAARCGHRIHRTGLAAHGRRGLCDERASRRHELAPGEQSPGGQGDLYPARDGGQTLCRRRQRRAGRDDRSRVRPAPLSGRWRSPWRPYLATLAIGDFTMVEQEGPDGRAVALLLPAGRG